MPAVEKVGHALLQGELLKTYGLTACYASYRAKVLLRGKVSDSDGFRGKNGKAARVPICAPSGCCGPGSRLSCRSERRCDARVRPQQLSCCCLFSLLCQIQRSLAPLQHRVGAWGRQAGP